VLASGLLSAGQLRGGEESPALKLPGALRTAAPNTWVKLNRGGYGPRVSAGLAFLPDEGRFVCFGGSMAARGSPYSEVTLNLETGQWENRFPEGKEGEWGAPTGPSRAPEFPYRSPAFRDPEGNVRPNLDYGYNFRMKLFGSFAYDRHRGKIVTAWHVLKKTAEYDTAARSWQLIETADDAPDEFWDDWVWGSMCYDPVNREVLGGQGRWAYRDGRWRRLRFGSPLINALRAKSEALHRRARRLAGACRARFYVTETAEMSEAPLDAVAVSIAAAASELAGEIRRGAAESHGHEKTQLDRALEDLTRARETLEKARGMLAGRIAPQTIHAAEDAADLLDRVTVDLVAVPPRRAFATLACDEAHGKIVLFGGHRLDRLLADTWVYDCQTRTWEERRPELSPSPRGGAGMVWLPGSGKILLVDGFGHGDRGETWTYDVGADEWYLLEEGVEEDGGPRSPMTAVPSTWGYQPEPAAAGTGDVVVALSNPYRPRRQDIRLCTWAARIDTSRIDPEGTKKLGVPPRSEKLNGGRHDPRWYDLNAGEIDTAATEAWLRRLPANTWTAREGGSNWPEQNRAWGTVALDPDGDQLLHWGGGHVAYDHNAVLHYSIRANRFYIGYPAEAGLMYCHGQGGMPISKSYRDRAFVPGHSYHSYGYDPLSGKMVACGQKQARANLYFAYDPAAAEWIPGPLPAPFHPDYEVDTVCSTPRGLVVWHGQQLWRLDPGSLKWEQLPEAGELPGQRPDFHGMTYDSRRDRLLFFCAYSKGEVLAYDLRSGRSATLDPAGKERAQASSREVVYIPELDAALVGATRNFGGKQRWLVYDCAGNAWLGLCLAGSEPVIGKSGFNAGLGLAYDARRKLVWAVDAWSHVFALRLDLETADAVGLESLPAPVAAGR
jgi:hypothetical protein